MAKVFTNQTTAFDNRTTPATNGADGMKMYFKKTGARPAVLMVHVRPAGTTDEMVPLEGFVFRKSTACKLDLAGFDYAFTLQLVGNPSAGAASATLDVA